MSVPELVVRHAAWIRNRAKRYYAEAADAEDLAGETIYKCLRLASHYDSEKDFKPWVATIMANTFINQYNRRKCVKFIVGIDDCLHPMTAGSADQMTRVKDIIRHIRHCYRKSVCLSAVVLYLKGYNYEEIAAIENITIGTVKSRLHAGRKMLRLLM